MEQKKAIFTGGGSAGHVTPNIALMRTLSREGVLIHYVGTDGIERGLVSHEPYVTYHTISAGKLRRYFSLKNAADAFRVLRGICQARRIIRREKPDVVFSKGGYVSVPVVLAACGRCPVIAHESDYTPGLSNKIANRCADRILVTFEDTQKYVGEKAVFTGTPIRSELYGGTAQCGYAFTGLTQGRPVLLVMGGSLGAAALNEALRNRLDRLLTFFQIVHLCGKGKLDADVRAEGYRQYEYIGKELPDLLAMADIVLSRAGANAVFEFLALKKPALLVPLGGNASRGDQLQNARYFEKNGYATVLTQEALTPETLEDALLTLYANRARYIEAMAHAPNADGTEAVLNILRGCLKNT